MKTLKASFAIGCHVKQDGFARRDEGQRAKPLGSRLVVMGSGVRNPQGDATQFGLRLLARK